jgi:hypothetical protein
MLPVPVNAVQVRCYKTESFLLVFDDRAEVDRVLHTPPPTAYLILVFRRWQRQHGALFSPLYFKVLLVSDKVLTHVWPEVAQQIVGSSCLIFDVALSSASGEYMSHFLATAWSLHPDLIPSEVGCVAPEPEEPSVVGLGDHPQQAEHALVQGLCKGNRGSQLHSAFRFFR